MEKQTMTKAELANLMVQKLKFTPKEATDLLELTLEIIKSTLEQGEEVMLSGFGKFSMHDKKVRTGRNPQTGESLELAARRVVTFKTSPNLKDVIMNAKPPVEIIDADTPAESIPPSI